MSINMEITYKVSKNIIEKIVEIPEITEELFENSGIYLDEDGIIRLMINHNGVVKDFYCVTGDAGESFIAYPKERCVILESEEDMNDCPFDLNFIYITKCVKGSDCYNYRKEAIMNHRGGCH